MCGEGDDDVDDVIAFRVERTPTRWSIVLSSCRFSDVQQLTMGFIFWVAPESILVQYDGAYE